MVEGPTNKVAEVLVTNISEDMTNVRDNLVELEQDMKRNCNVDTKYI